MVRYDLATELLEMDKGTLCETSAGTETEGESRMAEEKG